MRRDPLSKTLCSFLKTKRGQHHNTAALVGLGLPIIEVSRTHPVESSGRMISSSQGPLPVQHTTHKRQASMPTGGLEPAIPASERPKTHALRPRVHWGRLTVIFGSDFPVWPGDKQMKTNRKLNTAVFLDKIFYSPERTRLVFVTSHHQTRVKNV